MDPRSVSAQFRLVSMSSRASCGALAVAMPASVAVSPATPHRAAAAVEDHNAATYSMQGGGAVHLGPQD